MRLFRTSFVLATLVCVATASWADQRAGRDTSNRPDFAPGQYFVAFHDGVTNANERAVEAAGARVEARFAEIKVIAVRVNNERQLTGLQRNPHVEYIEQVPMRYKLDLASSQLTPSLTNGLYGLITTRATDVHSNRITGAGIKVGVADTGIDATHPDIAANYKGGIDTVGTGDNDPSWNNDPEETHGTHVAGTVLGVNNHSGVYGVAYSAELYHARVLGPNGGTTTDIMQGVRWLIETAGCKVVNLSLGGRSGSRTEERFYNDMRARGALVVAATGNDGMNRKLSYPAAYAANIAVGAVDRNNLRADFSNGGPNIDVVAPGVMVLSSVPAGQGFEASVMSGSEFPAFGLEFAGSTNGVTGTLVNCGLARSAGDCAGPIAGNIALIQRGDISFADKVSNVMGAGATAAIIYNNTAGDFTGTLGSAGTWIPAVSVSDVTGAALLSRAGQSTTVVNKASSWDAWDGTSMATPHVTGVVALIWSKNSGLSNTQVENALFSTAQDLGPAGYDYGYGRGLVNAAAAVASVPAR